MVFPAHPLHGNSSTPKVLRYCSFAEYVDNVESVASSLPTGPAVIGHSMGGLVVRKYLESHEAPAGVLVASMPPRGAFGFILRLAKRQPWRLTKTMVTGNSLQCVNTHEPAREASFPPRCPNPT